MAKKKETEEDNLDIWDKVLPLAPVAGAIAGGALGRRSFRKAAKRELGEQYEKLKPGEMVTAPDGRTRRATQQDVKDLTRMYKQHLGVEGLGGAALGATLGGALGAVPLIHHTAKRRRK